MGKMSSRIEKVENISNLEFQISDLPPNRTRAREGGGELKTQNSKLKTLLDGPSQ